MVISNKQFEMYLVKHAVNLDIYAFEISRGVEWLIGQTFDCLTLNTEAALCSETSVAVDQLMRGNTSEDSKSSSTAL